MFWNSNKVSLLGFLSLDWSSTGNWLYALAVQRSRSYQGKFKQRKQVILIILFPDNPALKIWFHGNRRASLTQNTGCMGFVIVYLRFLAWCDPDLNILDCPWCWHNHSQWWASYANRSAAKKVLLCSVVLAKIHISALTPAVGRCGPM
jgi:hypothetical protein